MSLIFLFIIGIPLMITVVFILPVWSLWDRYHNDLLSRGQRMLWSFCILMFWGLGAALYGYFAGRSKNLRRVSVAALIGLILEAAAVGYLFIRYPANGHSPLSNPNAPTQNAIG